MDPATIIGIILMLITTFVACTMAGIDPIAIFLGDIGSIILVVGGTIGASMAARTLPDTIGALKAIVKAFAGGLPGDKADAIRSMVEFAETARRDGLLALEEKARDIDDPFMRKGIQLAVDGADPEVVREILETDVATMEERHGKNADFYNAAAGYAPAFGVAGTVIGLVDMLGNLSDPEAIGPAMAVAFLTTLWGTFLANYIFGPIANRLKFLSSEEAAYRYMIIEGVLAIQNGTNPRSLADKLGGYLPPGEREGLLPEKKSA
jgi:chemotaxis protein MotA